MQRDLAAVQLMKTCTFSMENYETRGSKIVDENAK